MPSITEEWFEITDEFERKWNFPHAIGAIDGKYVMIQAPVISGTEYYNYKLFFSDILFGLVNANYNFIFADVGCQGRISDGGVFKNTTLYKKLENRTLNIPDPKAVRIPYSMDVPLMILEDKAFSFNDYTMRPFDGNPASGSPKRMLNYRHSRAPRVVENAFRMLNAVFRVLRKPVLLDPQTASKVTMTTVYLHNFLRKKSSGTYEQPGMFDVDKCGVVSEGTWRADQPNSSFLSLTNILERAKKIRNHLADYYFVLNDSLPWQNQY